VEAGAEPARPVRVGFTGTRRGMSQPQKDQLAFVLGICCLPPGQEFHYGTHESAVLLADVEAATIAASFGFRLRPHYARSGEELQRDMEQVASVDLLIAAPLTDREKIRSDTWATVRRARAARKPVVMLSRGDAARRAAPPDHLRLELVKRLTGGRHGGPRLTTDVTHHTD